MKLTTPAVPVIARALVAVLSSGIASSVSGVPPSLPTDAAGSGSSAPVGASFQGLNVAPQFFNPSLGQRVALTVQIPQSGSLSVEVRDRDGKTVRTVPSQKVSAGHFRYEWDGRDDGGVMVPAEAYYPYLKLESPASVLVHDPLSQSSGAPEFPVVEYYDRQSGLLSYRLRAPSRVHIQAGQAVRDQKSGNMRGPVLRTIVDREPRIAGKVIETWRGYDAAENVYLPDLPHFVMAVAATPLPPTSFIVVGTPGLSFRSYAIRRGPTVPRVLPVTAAASHHALLSSLEDRSPDLTLVPGQGEWDPSAKVWRVAGGPLVVQLDLPVDERSYFVSHAGTPVAFLDLQPVPGRFDAATGRLTLDIKPLPVTRQVLAVNWPSRHGPVAVGVLPLQKGRSGGDRATK